MNWRRVIERLNLGSIKHIYYRCWVQLTIFTIGVGFK